MTRNKLKIEELKNKKQFLHLVNKRVYIYIYISKDNLRLHFFFFFINVGVRANLRISRLILRALKLTII
jgi:hypothetical protein